MNYLNFKPLNEMDVEIHSDNKIYDLHNWADFKSLYYDIYYKKMILVWTYPSKFFIENYNGKWDKKLLDLNDIPLNHSQRLISLEFTNIKNFYYYKELEDLEQDNTLDEFNFIDKFDKSEFLRIEFYSDSYLIIDAESVYFNRDFKAEKILELLSLKLKL